MQSRLVRWLPVLLSLTAGAAPAAETVALEQEANT
jgi:hypothetical protein